MCIWLKGLAIHCIMRRLMVVIRCLWNMLVHEVMFIFEDNMLWCLLRLQAAALHARGRFYIKRLLLMMLLHILSLFVFPELQSVLYSLYVFGVCIWRNLNRGDRRTIAEVIWTIRHGSIHQMSWIVIMNLAVLFLWLLQSFVAIYICIIFMISIKVNGEASLIDIVIISVILIFAFWSYNLNIFGIICVKSELMNSLMTLIIILIGLFLHASYFKRTLVIVNLSNAVVMGIILFWRLSPVRLWMMMDIF